MKRILSLILIMTAIIPTLSYGMFRGLLSTTNRSSLRPIARTSTRHGKNIVYITPKFTRDTEGNIIVYSPQQQLVDLFSNTKEEALERTKNCLEIERNRIMEKALEKAEKEVNLFAQSMVSELEREVKLLDALPKEFVNDYVKKLEKEIIESKIIYVAPKNDQSKE